MAERKTNHMTDLQVDLNTRQEPCPGFPKSGGIYDCVVALDAFGKVRFLRAPEEIMNLLNEAGERDGDAWGIDRRKLNPGTVYRMKLKYWASSFGPDYECEDGLNVVEEEILFEGMIG